MKKIGVLLANGFEEMEAIILADILRRAGLGSVLIGLEKSRVVGAHGIEITADMLFDEIEIDEFEMMLLPGGLPGAENLANSQKVHDLLKEFDKNNLKIGAICAAPWALSTAGVLKNRYTCYPGFEKEIDKDGYESEPNVVKDGNIITSKGPATAMEFALEIVKELKGEEIYKKIKEGLLFKD